MRILHIAQSISGGIASYFEEIAADQARQFGPGRVRFLIPAGSRSHLPSVHSSQITEFSPVDRSLRGLTAFGIAARREVRRFDPAIVHLHSSFAGAIVRPAVAMSGRNPKVIYCAHGWCFALEAAEWKKKIYALIEKSLMPLTDAIVNVSHADSELARSYGIPTPKMITIRNAIAADPQLEGRSRRLGDDKDVNLIFVGRHDRQKGLDVLLSAFSSMSLPNVHLHVVGAPVLEQPSNVAERTLPSNVTFHGWQTRQSVTEMIAASDALIMPSRWEGLSIVALEAMRLGKPVLSSKCGAMVEVVQHQRTGMLFALDKPSELQSILTGLDKNALAALGMNARQEFLRLFTSDRLNEELQDLYCKLAGRPADTRAEAVNPKRSPSKVMAP